MGMDTKRYVRDAIRAAMENWPNAHLGEVSRCEDFKAACQFLRNHLAAGYSIQAAAGALYGSALAHSDM